MLAKLKCTDREIINKSTVVGAKGERSVHRSALDALARHEREVESAWMGHQCTNVNIGIGPIFGASDLQHVLAGVDGRHADLVDEPALDVFDRRGSDKGMVFGFGVEVKSDLDLAATMDNETPHVLAALVTER